MIRFEIGRVYLRKNQIVTFHSTVGSGYWYMWQNVAKSYDKYSFHGHYVGRHINITGMRMWYHTNSTAKELQFRAWVIKQTKAHKSTTYVNEFFKSDVVQPRHRGPLELSFDFDTSAKAGDVISVAFERIGTTGAGTYLLFPRATTIFTREP